MKKSFLFLLATIFFLSFSQFSFATEEMVMCTMEAKICPDGVTYVGRTGPQCEFEACPSVSATPKVCTKEYIPVCGQPKMPDCATGMACPMMMPMPTTYSNKCMMEAEGATFLYEGSCKTEIINTEVLSQKTKLKIDVAVKKITDKIDIKYTDGIKKSTLVYKIIERLNEKSPKSQKLQEAISYIIQKLEEYSRSVQDQSSWGLPD